MVETNRPILWSAFEGATKTIDASGLLSFGRNPTHQQPSIFCPESPDFSCRMFLLFLELLEFCRKGLIPFLKVLKGTLQIINFTWQLFDQFNWSSTIAGSSDFTKSALTRKRGITFFISSVLYGRILVLLYLFASECCVPSSWLNNGCLWKSTHELLFLRDIQYQQGRAPSQARWSLQKMVA